MRDRQTDRQTDSYLQFVFESRKSDRATEQGKPLKLTWFFKQAAWCLKAITMKALSTTNSAPSKNHAEQKSRKSSTSSTCTKATPT